VATLSGVCISCSVVSKVLVPKPSLHAARRTGTPLGCIVERLLGLIVSSQFDLRRFLLYTTYLAAAVLRWHFCVELLWADTKTHVPIVS
jgi:hypothetical protein